MHDETLEACAGTIWEGMAIKRSALSIGIPVGPGAAEHPFDQAKAKFCEVSREIGDLGLAPSLGSRLHRQLASPVLSYIAQLYAPTKDVLSSIRKSIQAVYHLPENGFSRVVIEHLDNLVPLGCPHTTTVMKASKVSAAVRLSAHIECELRRLESVFRDNDYRALRSLRPGCGFRPCGWDGDAFVCVLSESRVQHPGVVDARGRLARGKALTDSLAAVTNDEQLGAEIARRIALWLPVHLRPANLVKLCIAYLPSLRKTAPADAVAWLKIVQNSLSTKGRFGVFSPCLVCHQNKDSLAHIITCRQFWRPVLAIARPECRGGAHFC